MTLEEIETFKTKWVEAVKRAVRIGYDVSQVHDDCIQHHVSD